MGFFSFLKTTVRAIRSVANTVNHVLGIVEPAIEKLPTDATEDSGNPALAFTDSGLCMTQGSSRGIRVGLVHFDREALLIESTNLKRLNTLLYEISEQADMIDVEKGERVPSETINQFLWTQVCTSLIAEVVYQQEVLLKTDPGQEAEFSDWGSRMYGSLANISAGYATDYVVTAQHLDVLGEYSRSGTSQVYTGNALGRRNNWTVSGQLNLDDDDKANLVSFIPGWSTYMSNLADGRYGDRIKELYGIVG